MRVIRVLCRPRMLDEDAVADPDDGQVELMSAAVDMGEVGGHMAAVVSCGVVTPTTQSLDELVP